MNWHLDWLVFQAVLCWASFCSAAMQRSVCWRCKQTHRQWTTVRPSPHSLCQLWTWAKRLRKAFLESGTSRYGDQRKNWKWRSTSWPSWSLREEKRRVMGEIMRKWWMFSMELIIYILHITNLFEGLSGHQPVGILSASPATVLHF